MDTSVNLFHVLFVGPLLIYVALQNKSESFPMILWSVLAMMGLGVILYHGYEYYLGYGRNIRLLHILFVGPLFLGLGLYHGKVPKMGWNAVLGLGVLIIVYHAYLYMKKRNMNEKLAKLMPNSTKKN